MPACRASEAGRQEQAPREHNSNNTGRAGLYCTVCMYIHYIPTYIHTYIQAGRQAGRQAGKISKTGPGQGMAGQAGKTQVETHNIPPRGWQGPKRCGSAGANYAKVTRTREFDARRSSGTSEVGCRPAGPSDEDQLRARMLNWSKRRYGRRPDDGRRELGNGAMRRREVSPLVVGGEAKL